MPQQEADFFERRRLGEVVDVVSAVREHAAIAVQVADRRRCGDDVFESALGFLRSSHGPILRHCDERSGLSPRNTASTNCVVDQPGADPYSPSYSIVGFAAWTCANVMPRLTMSCTRSRMIVTMSRYSTRSASSEIRPWPGTIIVPPSVFSPGMASASSSFKPAITPVMLPPCAASITG